MKIAVLGSITIDLITKVPKIPHENEVVISEGLRLLPGGKAANTAIALSRLGSDSYMLGKIGNDGFGKNIKMIFKNEKVNMDFVDIDYVVPTGTVLVNVDQQGQNTIIVNEDANIRITTKSIANFLNKKVISKLLISY
ncbi:hypothetical protein HY030_04425 [Candidatus Gottesmanbacteria bacterium]|nr:hypothetical protein [Candidatus Gottesmanbacteria bacterium]